MPKVFFRPSDGRLRRLNTYKLASVRIQPADDALGFRVVAESSEEGVVRRGRRPAGPQCNPAEGQQHGRYRPYRTVRGFQNRVQRAPATIPVQCGETANWKGWPVFRVTCTGCRSRSSSPWRWHSMRNRSAAPSRVTSGGWSAPWREAEEIAAISDNLLLPTRGGRVWRGDGRNPWRRLKDSRTQHVPRDWAADIQLPALTAHPPVRYTLTILTGGASLCASWGARWIARTTSIPSTTLPKAANPCPSALRFPAEVE